MRWVIGDDVTAPVDLGLAYAVPNRDQLAPGRCFVRANMATSIGGAVEANGKSHGVSSDVDREIFHTMRALADVVLVGAQTVRAEGYGPAKPAAEAVARRVESGFEPVPPIAVVTRGAELDPSSRLFTEAKVTTMVITSERGRAEAGALAEVAEIVVCGETDVDMGRMIAALHDRGLTRVLCEGGPHLLTQLISDDLLDELCLTLSPLTVGPEAHNIATAPLEPPRGFPIAGAIEAEGSLFLRCAKAGR